MNHSRSRLRHLSAIAVFLALVLTGFGCADRPSAVTGRVVPNRPTVKPPSGPPPAPVAAENVKTEKAKATVKCTNEFFPQKNGRRVKYTLNDGAGSATMTARIAADGGLKMAFSDDGRTVRTEWRLSCDGGSIGALTYFDPESLVGSAPELETQNVRGVFLPPDLKPGSAWTVSYDVVEHSAGAGAKSTTPDQVSHIQFRNEAIGFEQTIVPAGTFDALRIRSAMTSVAETPGTSKLLPVVTGIRNEWWVKGVGLIKMSDESGGFSMTATEISK